MEVILIGMCWFVIGVYVGAYLQERIDERKGGAR